jgi:quinolinate synthase
MSQYEKVAKVIPEIEWPFFEPYITSINRLKKEKNAVILAHNYMTPEIYHCVADIVGDSLLLAKEAANTTADTIIMCGVYFMAETAKLMSPEKKVLIPDARAGCSLSESITGKDVRLLKQKYPGVPVVTYVNTSADVKAETDICCTSGNAVEIVESLGVDKVIFLPDEYLAKNIAKQTKVKIISWHGTCMVHEKFTAEEIRQYRNDNPGITILAHPECPPDVIAEVDFTGSTSKMSNYVKDKQPSKVLMVTECSMSDNVSIENPNVEFVRPCNLCPHMKRITLAGILQSLMLNTYEVKIPYHIMKRAKRPIERMVYGI